MFIMCFSLPFFLLNRFFISFFPFQLISFLFLIAFIVFSSTTELLTEIALSLEIFLENIYYYKVWFVCLEVFLTYCDSWNIFSVCGIYRTQYIFLSTSRSCLQLSFGSIEKLLRSQVVNNGWSFKNNLIFSMANSKSPCYL